MSRQATDFFSGDCREISRLKLIRLVAARRGQGPPLDSRHQLPIPATGQPGELGDGYLSVRIRRMIIIANNDNDPGLQTTFPSYRQLPMLYCCYPRAYPDLAHTHRLSASMFPRICLQDRTMLAPIAYHLGSRTSC